MNSQPQLWHEVNARDGNKAGDFYTRLFDWSSQDVNMGPGGTYTLFKQNGKDIGGIARMSSPSWEGMPPMWSVYIQVDDVDASAGKAVELGGSICVNPFDIPSIGRSCVIADPEGATFYLFAPAKQP